MSLPEDESEETFAYRVARAAESVRRYRAYLMIHGLDAKEFLAACDLVLQANAGKPQPEGAVENASKAIGEFVKRLAALPDFPPQWSEEEEKQWTMASDLLNFDEMMGKAAEAMKGTKSERFGQEAAALREKFNEAARAGKNPLEIMEDFKLSLTAEMGEISRRVKFRNAALTIYWEQLPQEKWDEMSLEGKDQLLDILKQWREEEREKILSSLPIEDRRRLEAMEDFAPGDWEKPGVCEP